MERTAGLSKSLEDGPWWLDFKRRNRCETIDMQSSSCTAAVRK